MSRLSINAEAANSSLNNALPARDFHHLSANEPVLARWWMEADRAYTQTSARWIKMFVINNDGKGSLLSYSPAGGLLTRRSL